jgi:hypothetical protein
VRLARLVEGARPDGNGVTNANVRRATPGYFATLGLPLVSGREFSAQDDVDAPRVIIINESLARTAWNGEDPPGRTHSVVTPIFEMRFAP